jgi:hypothetical protein
VAATSLVLILLALAVTGRPALAQEPSTTVPGATTDSTGLAPIIGDGVDGDGGSPRIFAAISLLGGTTAVAIMAVQWFRTRPRTKPPPD